MAIDTRNRRAACLALDLGHGRAFPNPDGTISGQDDRQHMGLVYPGILASGAGVSLIALERSVSRRVFGRIFGRVN